MVKTYYRLILIGIAIKVGKFSILSFFKDFTFYIMFKSTIIIRFDKTSFLLYLFIK